MINRIRISLLLAIALYCLPGPLLLARSCSDAEVDSLQSLLTLSDISSAQRSDALFQLAYCMLKKDLDSALVYADEGLRLSEQVNYVSGTAKYYFILGKVKEISRSYEEAKQNYLRSIKLFDQVEKSEMYLRTCNSIAFIYEIQTDYDKALEYYMLGLEFARELKDILFIASFYNNISNVYSALGLTRESLEMMFMASPIFKEVGHEIYYANSIGNIAIRYLSLEMYDSAMYYLEIAGDLQEGLNNVYGLIHNKKNKGDVQSELKDFPAAITHYNSAMDFVYKLDSLHPEKYMLTGWTQRGLGSAYLGAMNLSEAINHFIVSGTIGDSIRSYAMMAQSYSGLSSAYESMNRLDSALYFNKLFQVATDSMLSERYNEQIIHFDYQHTSKMEKLNYESELLIKTLEKQRQELIIFSLLGILASLFIIAFFIVYIQRNRIRKKELLNRELTLERKKLLFEIDQKKKELTSSIMRLIERNETLTSVSEKIQNLDYKPEKLDQNAIEEIVRSMKLGSNSSLWKEFELRFIEVHSVFYNNLSENYPALTSNERRICAFLYLNMSTKEISSITFQSHQSIKIARYRLRKKLGIDKNANLHSFLISLS